MLTCSAQIIMNGYPHLDNKAEYSFNERASDIMTTGNLIVLVYHPRPLFSFIFTRFSSAYAREHHRQHRAAAESVPFSR
jgi:hypothetical protein